MGSRGRLLPPPRLLLCGLARVQERRDGFVDEVERAPGHHGHAEELTHLAERLGLAHGAEERHTVIYGRAEKTRTTERRCSFVKESTSDVPTVSLGRCQALFSIIRNRSLCVIYYI